MTNFSKKKNCFQYAYFTLNIRNVSNIIFRSDPFITPHKKSNYLKKNEDFLNNIVGTFCATCTATGYSCLDSFSIEKCYYYFWRNK